MLDGWMAGWLGCAAGAAKKYEGEHGNGSHLIAFSTRLSEHAA